VYVASEVEGPYGYMTGRLIKRKEYNVLFCMNISKLT